MATLGASNYTYAEATWTQTLPDWIASHQRAFQFIAGVTEVVVPDNLRAGVSKAHRYEPDINPTYQDMAAHYNVPWCEATQGQSQGRSRRTGSGTLDPGAASPAYVLLTR